FQRRVLQRPPASDQQSPLDPIRAIETPMSKQAMIPDGNPQTRNDIEEAEHGPIHPGVIIKIGEGGHTNDSTRGDETKEKNGAVVPCSGRSLYWVGSGNHQLMFSRVRVEGAPLVEAPLFTAVTVTSSVAIPAPGESSA